MNWIIPIVRGRNIRRLYIGSYACTSNACYPTNNLSPHSFSWPGATGTSVALWYLFSSSYLGFDLRFWIIFVGGWDRIPVTCRSYWVRICGNLSWVVYWYIFLWLIAGARTIIATDLSSSSTICSNVRTI